MRSNWACPEWPRETSDFILTPPRAARITPLTPALGCWPRWATGRKVWQGTVTPSRRRTPGSIPGSPTIFQQFAPSSRHFGKGSDDTCSAIASTSSGFYVNFRNSFVWSNISSKSSIRAFVPSQLCDWMAEIMVSISSMMVVDESHAEGTTMRLVRQISAS